MRISVKEIIIRRSDHVDSLRDYWSSMESARSELLVLRKNDGMITEQDKKFLLDAVAAAQHAAYAASCTSVIGLYHPKSKVPLQSKLYYSKWTAQRHGGATSGPLSVSRSKRADKLSETIKMELRKAQGNQD